MIIKLEDTSTREVLDALAEAHGVAGPSTGMVLTLIVVAHRQDCAAVLDATRDAASANPARVILATYGHGDQANLDAEIQVGEDLPGELIQLHMSGAVAEHAGSVILPLLLPESPTVAWWPSGAPEHPERDSVGKLAQRRITDATTEPNPCQALRRRAANHAPGDTDLTWTRLTRWRALLAASLDQHPAAVSAARVTSDPTNAPALLLRAWLAERLDLDVEHITTEDPGISAVTLTTDDGDIVINRGSSEGVATYRVPGQPERKVALQRRELPDLLTEELRRLDPDDIFEAALARLAQEGTS